MLIDTHSHLNFAVYDKDKHEVIKRTLERNTWLVNVGSNYETSKKAVELAQKYEKGVYAAVGLHPINISRLKTQNLIENRLEDDFSYKKYKKLAAFKKVVAIGEIGFDYWYKPKTKKRISEFKEKQREVFLRQLALAKELNLPLILHCRLAHEELSDIIAKTMKEVGYGAIRGVVHCFSGAWKQAERYLEMGFYLGFNGIIFKLNLDEIIKKTPIERILIETDSPYLTPPPVQIARNEPIYVKYVAQRIAEIRDESFKKIAETTTKNARELFRI